MGEFNPKGAAMLMQAQLAEKSRNMYHKAFLEQTGLQPNQVVMIYGEEIVEQAGKLMKQFKVRFVQHDMAQELSGLEEQIANLGVKNHAMQMVLSAVATKAEVPSEQLVKLLQAAERELRGGEGPGAESEEGSPEPDAAPEP